MQICAFSSILVAKKGFYTYPNLLIMSYFVFIFTYCRPCLLQMTPLLDPMTLIRETDLAILKMYLHARN